jgi:hypothetical protein
VYSNELDQGRKITPDNLSSKFSIAELAFAASALGLRHVELFSPEGCENPEQLTAMGQRSLQARGLVRGGVSTQIEMDVFLDGLIHWIQDPEWEMVFKVHRPIADDTWTVFFRQDYLLCHHISEGVELTLFESAEKARLNILHQIGLGMVADPLPTFQREEVQAIIDVSLWQKRQGEKVFMGNKRFYNTPQGSYLEIAEADESRYRAVSMNDLFSMGFI